MKVSLINIAPVQSWQEISEKNPLRATVKLLSDETTVETVLDNEDMEELLTLVEHIVARAAKRNVEQFVAAVSGRHQQTIEGEVGEQ